MKKILFTLLAVFSGLLAFGQSQTLSGEYRSIMGVRNNLSCYCYNGGFLTLTNGESFNICFDKLKIDKVESGTITVSGHFEDVERESGPIDPCPSGSIKLFIVEELNPSSDNTGFFDEWAGTWKTDYGDLALIVSDDVLSGSYNTGTLSGNFELTESGSQVNGYRSQSDNEGWFWFYKDAGSTSFSGEWGYNEDVENKTGDWNGTKKSSDIANPFLGAWHTQVEGGREYLDIRLNGTGSYHIDMGDPNSPYELKWKVSGNKLTLTFMNPNIPKQSFEIKNGKLTGDYTEYVR